MVSAYLVDGNEALKKHVKRRVMKTMRSGPGKINKSLTGTSTTNNP